MSIFLLNPEHVSELTNFKVGQNETTIEDIPLTKTDESSYSSDIFDVPSGKFEIFIEGWDSIGNPIFREFDVDPGITPDEEKEMRDLLKSWKFEFIFKKFKGLSLDCFILLKIS